MASLDIFRDLGSADGRLEFYTSETCEEIPECTGCYAWFLPLWFYREDIDEFMGVVGNLVAYDQISEREIDAHFTWESVTLRVKRNAKFRLTNKTRATWISICSNESKRQVLQKILLEASLLMPPLYVGRTGNLKQRYLQHTDRRESAKSTFRFRFAEYVSRLGVEITMSDLLFVCIKTESNLDKIFSDAEQKDVDALIESILMQSCRPPFSLK